MKDRIEIGDHVSVMFYNGQSALSHRAEVLYKPNGVGDSWIFKDVYTDKVYYVSEGCTLEKLSKEDWDRTVF